MTTIAPWLLVHSGARAVAFYEAAFSAEVLYRLDGDVVAQLAIDGAQFWVQEKPGAKPDGSVRMIVNVETPDTLFKRAVGAGATVVSEVHEEHGWRTGRVRDPFGYDWELSRQLT